MLSRSKPYSSDFLLSILLCHSSIWMSTKLSMVVAPALSKASPSVAYPIFKPYKVLSCLAKLTSHTFYKIQVEKALSTPKKFGAVARGGLTFPPITHVGA